MDKRPDPTKSATAKQPGPLALVGGVLLLLLWLGLSAAWFLMSMMGGLMANDSGAASSSAHSGLLGGLVVGQILTTLAGVFGSTGLFWPAKRRRFLLTGLSLLLIGSAIQFAAFHFFMQAASAS